MASLSDILFGAQPNPSLWKMPDNFPAGFDLARDLSSYLRWLLHNGALHAPTRNNVGAFKGWLAQNPTQGRNYYELGNQWLEQGRIWQWDSTKHTDPQNLSDEFLSWKGLPDFFTGNHAYRDLSQPDQMSAFRQWLADDPRRGRDYYEAFTHWVANGQPVPSTPAPDGGDPRRATAPPVTTPPPDAPGGSTEQFYDPYLLYLATLPLFQRQAREGVEKGLAEAGFTGNRWGSAAAGTVARETANAEQMANQFLVKTLYDHANRDQDRALQGTRLGLDYMALMDAVTNNRLDQLFKFGTWEQGRQDDFFKFFWDDFRENQYGLLPLLLGFAGGQGQPMPGDTIFDPGQGGRGLLDWLALFYGMR